jgi:hypothetical protein
MKLIKEACCYGHYVFFLLVQDCEPEDKASDEHEETYGNDKP